MKNIFLAGLLLAASSAALAQSGNDRDRGSPAAAIDQIDQVAEAAAYYRDIRVAEREGWKKFGGDEPLMGEHWYDPEGPDYVAGDRLDFSRPSNLMYTDIDGEKVLTGVAFVVRLGPGEDVPRGFAGNADRWHVHDFGNALAAALVDRPLLGWLANSWINENYRNKGDNRGRLAMAHVWATLPNPDGVFADYNRTLPYLKLGLPATFAEGADEAAARGLHLATERGCAETLDGPIWIANTGRARAEQLRAACADAAAHVREALPSRDRNRINEMAGHGWAMFRETWDRVLTTEQRARIAAMTEHGEHHDEPPVAERHEHHGH